MYPESLKNLIESFKLLPGIGEKTAERLAFHIINEDIDKKILMIKILIALYVDIQIKYLIIIL